MVDFKRKDFYKLSDLREIVRLLRAPGGCPWDREQTHESIKRNFLEEAYEVVEAIEEGSRAHLREELGDVLLQVMFHSSIEEDAGHFDLDAVADTVSRKLIFRHPHVFGDATVTDTGEVLSNWDALKRVEKGQSTTADAVDAVARSLPSLWRAEKIQQKAKKVGFDWPDVSGAEEKLGEELEELGQAIAEQSNMEEELGDLLFAAVNVARHLSIDPEAALHAACDKFAKRFRRVEELASQSADGMEGMCLTELDALWDKAKQTISSNTIDVKK